MSYKNYQSGMTAVTSVAAIPGVTGDGTAYRIKPDQILYNYLDQYDPVTGVYTPSALYTGQSIGVLISGTIGISGLLVANDSLDVSIYTGGGGNPDTQLQVITRFNPFPVALSDGTLWFNINALCTGISPTVSMGIVLTVSGNATANVGIIGSNGSIPFYENLTVTQILG